MERVRIGSNYLKQPTWKLFLGAPLIYFPLITTTPFLLVGVLLVKTHLNWCCPFDHDKKEEYSESATDKSYWYLHTAEREKLHHDDVSNPTWNEDTYQGKTETAG